MIMVDIVFLRYFYVYGNHYLNSDPGSEILLANLLNKTGEIFSKRWYYSTEIRLIDIAMIYRIGLRLFNSWHSVRCFAITLALAMLQISAIYMVRTLGLKKTAPIFAAILAIPFSEHYMFLVAYGCVYSGHIVLAFLQLGLAIRCARDRAVGQQAIRYIALLLIGVISGLHGIRMLMLVGLPYILATCIIALNSAKKYDLKSIWDMEEGRLILGSVATFAGLICGYLINAKILASIFYFKTYDDTLLLPFLMDSFIRQFQFFIEMLGYTNGILFTSVEGIGSILSIFLCIIMFALGAVQVARIYKNQLSPEKMIGNAFIILAVVCGMLINSTTGKGLYGEASAVAYYFIGFLLMITLIFQYIEKSEFQIPGIKTLLSIATVGVFFINGYNTVQINLHGWENPIESAAYWLDENGYTKGFATFWNGNVLTEATDGRVEVWVLEDRGEKFAVYKWLQEVSHSEELPKDEVFFVAQNYEVEAHPELFTEERKVFEADGIMVFLFHSANEIPIVAN